MNKNVLSFIACDSSYKESKIVLFGAPFDSTVSNKPGSRFAPNAIRLESFGLETYSPYQDLDLVDYKVFDSGDLELPFGNAKKALKIIEDRTKKILSDNKIPFLIGGEHLVTLGQFEAIKKKYEDVYIIHLDAHTDLREEYLGEKLSHATVIKRCYDLVGDNHIFQFGIRSGEKYEFEFAKKHNYINKFNLDTMDEIVNILKGKNVYLTIDLDVLDPSCFPGTGTPEAGGVTFNELIKAIKLFKKLNLVGLDVVELAPDYDLSRASTAIACKVIRELLLVLGGNDNE